MAIKWVVQKVMTAVTCSSTVYIHILLSTDTKISAKSYFCECGHKPDDVNIRVT